MLNTPVMIYLQVEGAVQQGIVWERNASFPGMEGKAPINTTQLNTRPSFRRPLVKKVKIQV